MPLDECGYSRIVVFQSAPGREAGRCAAGAAIWWVAKCFNPRPAVRPGDAWNRTCPRSFSPGFNPRPAVRPGDAAGWVGGFTGYKGFQSAPGREAGRCG